VILDSQTLCRQFRTCREKCFIALREQVHSIDQQSDTPRLIVQSVEKVLKFGAINGRGRRCPSAAT
jgi:Fe-S-cluster-containing hydrogenase component 2